VHPPDAFVLGLLLLMAGIVLCGGIALLLTQRNVRSGAPGLAAAASLPAKPHPRQPDVSPAPAMRPAMWMAIRSRDTRAVQTALGLSNPAPCSWDQSVIAGHRLFIAPPVQGWTLVFGTALPDPGDDVDVTFRFVRELSRQLGQVQFFQADPLLQHHAWVLAESGRIVRAYAWAGATVWNQGVKTAVEIALGVKCFGYAETPVLDDWSAADFIVANVQKVPQIARRWSLDPAQIDLRALANIQGIAGDSGRNN
jgi:hypothetical protein